MRRAPLLFLLALPLAACAWEQSAIGAGEDSQAAIPRFQAVVPGLYRGGQPTPAGFRFLKWRGIKTVIHLREEHDERELVEKLGMKYVHIPLHAWDPVSDDAIRTFFRAVNDPANQPVFVHCQRGTDRTGVMVGFYRIAFEGWDEPRAYKEARAIGMRWWYRGLKKQLLGFAERPRGGRLYKPIPEA